VKDRQTAPLRGSHRTDCITPT